MSTLITAHCIGLINSSTHDSKVMTKRDNDTTFNKDTDYWYLLPNKLTKLDNIIYCNNYIFKDDVPHCLKHLSTDWNWVTLVTTRCIYIITSVTRAYGRDFTIALKMQKYTPAYYIWKHA